MPRTEPATGSDRPSRNGHRPRQRSKVLVVGGGQRRPSRTRCLLDGARAALERRGAVTEMVDPLDLEPPLSRCCARDPDPSCTLRKGTAEAAAVVLATPVYHSSYAGLVKYALDHLGRNAFRGKPVALMAAGGKFRSTQALDHLRAVVRALHGLALPSQVVAVDEDFSRSSDGFELRASEVREQIEALSSELLWMASRLRGADPRPEAESGNGSERPDLPGRHGGDPIADAVRFIQVNFHRGDMCLDMVAREVCLSRYHLSRTFRLRTGRRFIDFLTEMRLSRARTLIAENEKSITEICYEVGYNDLSHFERTFKRRTGMSPSQYRKESASRPAVDERNISSNIARDVALR